jgi:DNA-binding NtrC family response regulator
MKKVEILVIGRNPAIMETVVRLVNQNEEWNAAGALTDEAAIELFHKYSFDLVLLGSGIEEASENKLRKLFNYQRPGIIIIEHFGGGSGLLSNEIVIALDKKAMEEKPAIHFKDGLY